MALDSFTKQSYESFIITAQFPNIATGEEVIPASSTVTALDVDGTDATSTILDGSPTGSGQLLSIRVKDGVTAESPYKITFKAVTDAADKWELDVLMKIKEL